MDFVERVDESASRSKTNPNSLAEVTFYGTSVTYMDGQLSQVDAAYDGSPLYTGIAIDDYLGYRPLPS